MKDMSNFQRVALINTIAGNKPNDSWDGLKKQMKIIDGEYKELSEGVELHDLHEMVDGAADTLVTVYGILFRAGVNADLIMEEVCSSLLTRFDLTEEDALKTKTKYHDMGIETLTRDVFVDGTCYRVTISSKDQVDAKGEKFPEGKFLKSWKFRQPNLKPLIPEAVTEKLAVVQQA